MGNTLAQWHPAWFALSHTHRDVSNQNKHACKLQASKHVRTQQHISSHPSHPPLVCKYISILTQFTCSVLLHQPVDQTVAFLNGAHCHVQTAKASSRAVAAHKPSNTHSGILVQALKNYENITMNFCRALTFLWIFTTACQYFTKGAGKRVTLNSK